MCSILCLSLGPGRLVRASGWGQLNMREGPTTPRSPLQGQQIKLVDTAAWIRRAKLGQYDDCSGHPILPRPAHPNPAGPANRAGERCRLDPAGQAGATLMTFKPTPPPPPLQGQQIEMVDTAGWIRRAKLGQFDDSGGAVAAQTVEEGRSVMQFVHVVALVVDVVRCGCC